MEQKKIHELAAHCNDIEELLKEYDSVTDCLLICETENSEEIDSLIDRRQQLIQRIDEHKTACTELIDGENEETAALLRSFFTSSTSVHAPKELLPVYNAAVNLRSAQLAAAEKEKRLQLQFTSRYNEIKDQLEKLREDKKKINFYSAMKSPSAVGTTFDSRS